MSLCALGVDEKFCMDQIPNKYKARIAERNILTFFIVCIFMAGVPKMSTAMVINQLITSFMMHMKVPGLYFLSVNSVFLSLWLHGVTVRSMP